MRILKVEARNEDHVNWTIVEDAGHTILEVGDEPYEVFAWKFNRILERFGGSDEIQLSYRERNVDAAFLAGQLYERMRENRSGVPVEVHL